MIISNSREEGINEIFCMSCLSFRLIKGIKEECEICESPLVIIAGFGTMDGEAMRSEAISQMEE